MSEREQSCLDPRLQLYFSPEAKFFGDQDSGECFFTIQEWITFQAELQVAHSAMQLIRHGTNLKLLSNTYKGWWPERRLVRPRRSATKYLTIGLNPNWLADHVHVYSIAFGTIKHGWLSSRDSEYQELDVIGPVLATDWSYLFPRLCAYASML